MRFTQWWAPMVDRIIAAVMLTDELTPDDYATAVRALTDRIDRIDRKRTRLGMRRATLARERDDLRSRMRAMTRSVP